MFSPLANRDMSASYVSLPELVGILEFRELQTLHQACNIQKWLSDCFVLPLLEGSHVSLAKRIERSHFRLHPEKLTCWTQSHGALVQMIFRISTGWFLSWKLIFRVCFRMVDSKYMNPSPESSWCFKGNNLKLLPVYVLFTISLGRLFWIYQRKNSENTCRFAFEMIFLCSICMHLQWIVMGICGLTQK